MKKTVKKSWKDFQQQNIAMDKLSKIKGGEGDFIVTEDIIP